MVRIFIILALLFPSAAAMACAVCGGQDPESTRIAFLLTTALLSAVPLVFIGGIIYYIRRNKGAAPP